MVALPQPVELRQPWAYAADMGNRELIGWLDARIAERHTTAAAVAEAAGLNKSTITKWRRGQRPNPVDLRAVAAALKSPVLEAFLVAGYLHASDTENVVEVDRPLAHRSDDELLAEVTRRLKEVRNVVEAAPKPDASSEGHETEEAPYDRKHVPVNQARLATGKPGATERPTPSRRRARK